MKKNKSGLTLKKRVKNFFTKNLVIKIVSFVFAMLLWGYVMTALNPARTKTISNVNIVFEGEADLLSRNLVIATSDEELQKTISVQVDTELTKYADLSSANITAAINLRSITTAGVYELPVTAVTTEGTIRRTSISPAIVRLTIDDLITKSVPISLHISGELPDGYWHGEPELAKSEIDVSGPAEYINAVSSAICNINLSDRTRTFTEAIELVLTRQDGSVVSKSLITGKVPTVSVKTEILKKATLKVDVEASLLGADALPANYEISGMTSSPDQITVVGEEAALNGLTSVTVLPINIAGQNENITKSVPLILPDGVKSIDETAVTVYISISEIQDQANYAAKSIDVTGLARRLTATLTPRYTSIMLSGRKTLINELNASKVRLYVDLTGLGAGEHTCPVLIEFSDSKYEELAAVLSEKNISVVIRSS